MARRYITYLIVTLVIVSIFHIRLTNASELIILAENVPPFSYIKNGYVTGFSTEILEQLLRDAGIHQEQKAQIYPWARAYYTIQNEPNVALLNMTRSEKRETLFK